MPRTVDLKGKRAKRVSAAQRLRWNTRLKAEYQQLRDFVGSEDAQWEIGQSRRREAWLAQEALMASRTTPGSSGVQEAAIGHPGAAAEPQCRCRQE